MDTLLLKAQSRDLKEKAKYIRTQGYIPAIYYGGKKKNMALKVPYQDFRKIYAEGGSNTVIDLDLDGNSTLKVLIQDVQMNPVRDTFEHIDLIHVDMSKKIDTAVPLEFVGVAPAVKDLGGVLTVNKHEMEVRCLPENIPHSISVDISSLVDFHTSIHVSDIQVPEGVEVLDNSELTIASVTSVKEEVEEIKVEASAEGSEASTEAAKEGDTGKQTA